MNGVEGRSETMAENMYSIKKSRIPSKFEALLPIVVLLVILIPNYIFHWGIDPHIPIVIAAAVGMMVGRLCGYSYNAMLAGMLNTINRTMEAMLILMLVGCLTASWILSGTIPAIVYYGLNFLSPKIFLPVGLILCVTIGLACGSAWTTTATLGVAFMSMGAGLGINPAITAGMCISGAAMGDKLSPLSDSTNLAAGVSETNLFDHINAMLTTTVPSFFIALFIYGGISFFMTSKNYDDQIALELQQTLNEHFELSPILLIPALVIILVAVFRIPAIPGIFISSITGFIFALIFQKSGVIDCIISAHYGYSASTENELADALLNRGGMNAMMWTINLAIVAIGFGGLMEKIGIVESLLGKLVHKIKGVFSLILITMVTSLFCNLSMCDQYLALIIPASMYKDLYDKHGLARNLLSRTLEDMGTLWSPMIPWTSCGAHHTAMLGVSPVQYFPFAFIPLVTPVVALVAAYFGRLIFYADGTQTGLCSKRLKKRAPAFAPDYSLEISLAALEKIRGEKDEEEK